MKRGISIIVPTYKEAKTILALLEQFKSLEETETHEVIIVDSNESNDQLKSIVAKYNFQYIKSSYTCRSIQLNEGARMAKFDILYFVHADVIPPDNFLVKIHDSIKNGNSFGYFRYQFKSKKLLLKINSYFSQFKGFYTGGGDQTFFILRSVFEEKGGFNEALKLCEDFDLFDKLKKDYAYEIINSKVIVSDRKYQRANYFRINLVNLYILLKFRAGHNTQDLKLIYERLLG